MLFYFVVLLLPLTEAVPSPVTGVMLSLVPGEAAITVTWDMAMSDQPIIRYEAEYGINHYTTSATTVSVQGADTLTVTITGLQRGERYVVHVRAVSNAGNGPYNAFPDQRINIPNFPPQVSVVPGQAATIRVTWTKFTIGETAIIGYDVQYKTSSTQDWDGISTTRVTGENTVTVDLPGLQRGTTYNVRVRAVSNTVIGPYSQEATYTLPRPPSSLNLEVVSSTVIRVTWTAPPNADRLPLTYLISYQSEFDSGMKEVSTQPVELTGLHPFAEYTVSVQARNTGGQLTVIVTVKSATLSAAPSSPPRSVLIDDALKTHDSLTCTWQLPIKTGRNGIITSYFIIVTRVSGEEQQPLGNFTKLVDNPSFDAPTHLRYTFTNLTAITYYSIRIAAVTSAGTGVFSYLLTRRTNYELYVSRLTIQVDSDTSSTISWTAPEGEVVSSYPVYYSTYLIGTFMSRTTSTTSLQLSNLTPEVPIEVSVIPVTAQGPGGSVSRMFFTREGVPTDPVNNVTVMRINNGVSLSVSWTPLSLHEARGWPLYTVIVESTAGRTTRAIVTSNTNDSTVDVDGLDPSTWYSLRVQVGTSAGTSAALISNIVLVPPVPTDPPAGDVNTAAIAAVLVVIILVIIAIAITVVALAVMCSCRNEENGSDPNTVEMTQSPAYESVDEAYEDVSHVQPHQQHYEPGLGNEDYNAIINYRSKESGSDSNAVEMTQSPAYESVAKVYI